MTHQASGSELPCSFNPPSEQLACAEEVEVKSHQGTSPSSSLKPMQEGIDEGLPNQVKKDAEGKIDKTREKPQKEEHKEAGGNDAEEEPTFFSTLLKKYIDSYTKSRVCAQAYPQYMQQ